MLERGYLQKNANYMNRPFLLRLRCLAHFIHLNLAITFLKKHSMYCISDVIFF